MLNALNIQTREVIATGTDRKALATAAAAIVGREGFCIRAVAEEAVSLPTNWGATDGAWWN